MSGKSMTLTFYRQEHLRPDWRVDLAAPEAASALAALTADLAPLGISLSITHTDSFCIAVNSYADLLNAVRVSSPSDGFSNVCLGHILGKSPNLDLMEDIRSAVFRIAFAPETVPPEDHNRRVCHNCGCGC